MKLELCYIMNTSPQELNITGFLRFARILLISVAVYSLFQIGCYAATVAQIPCTSALNLTVTLMCSYIAQFLTCAIFFYTITTLKLRVLAIILGSLTIIYKLLSVIYLALVGSTHLGDCYILTPTRQVMISSLSIEFALMIALIVCIDIVRSRVELFFLMNK